MKLEVEVGKKLRSKLIKAALTIIMALAILGGFTQAAYSDVGPKPSLTIFVKGIDTDEYWLDLLVAGEANYSWLKISDQEKKQVAKLAEYSDTDGFHPALLGGTQVPLVGGLKGERLVDGSFKHSFSYVGVPKIFKIAILKADGTLIVSDVVNRKQFTSVMTYDLRGLKITEDSAESAGIVTEGMSWGKFAKSSIVNLVLTLIIELSIAVFFGFTLKNNLRILLIANILTQILLNLLVFFCFNSLGLFGAALGFVIGEILVLTIEAKVYRSKLVEGTKAQRTAYAVTANLLSLLGGLLIFYI